MISNTRRKKISLSKNQNAASLQPTKKMKIKLIKSKPKLPENFETKSWDRLHETILAVQNKQHISHSREELYRDVEDLCIHKLSANLYKRLKNDLNDHISKVIEKLNSECNLPDHLTFLLKVNQVWLDHCPCMLTIRSIFLYLDRTYVINFTTSKIHSIWDLGLDLFRQHLESKPNVENRIVSGLLVLIEKERSGETINRSMVKSILRMLQSLKLYKAKFLNPFLDETKSYYKLESQRYLNQTKLFDYLIHVEKRLYEESNRVDNYLIPSTRSSLIHAVEHELLKVHIGTILENGFDSLVENNRITDLSRMYQLFERVAGLEDLKAAFGVYIKRTGMQIVQDTDRDKEMVQDLLDIKSKLDNLVSKAFKNNQEFERTSKDSFISFINSRENRPAELIAKFIDVQLKSGSKSKQLRGDQTIELLLDRVMVLFRFVNGKDVFEAFYKKDLAKRLLLDKSASYDLEKAMISKLKCECGASFTNKLEGMFKDIDLSTDVMNTFLTNLNAKTQLTSSSSSLPSSKNKLDVNVRILTSGYWPSYPTMDVILPVQLGEQQKVFSDFYLSKHQGRRLTWQHSLGRCVLRANFNDGTTKHELCVTLFQTLILLLFNDVGSNALPLSDIAEQTKIEDGDLRRTLQSLACGKIGTRVLTKIPKSKEINDDDKFVFNNTFKNKAYRISINQIQMKETKKENEETKAHVFQDRQYQIDAAIVRIMKARKRLTHTLLIAELFKQLKFPAKPGDLKKRIESLIDREYIERDEEENNIYNYMA